MDNNNFNLYEKIINKNKYVILRNFLENNKREIIKALQNRAKYKNIYDTFEEISNIEIGYKSFCKILSEFKLKYIYNNIEIKSSHACRRISSQNQNAINTKDEVKKLSRKEKLLSRMNASDEEKIIDIQKNQEKFVWRPSIKE